jgi:antitoxin ParD1/3/4
MPSETAQFPCVFLRCRNERFCNHPGCRHVREARLSNADDADVWNYAAANSLIVVSKDQDFRQRAMLLGPPPKCGWLRLGNCSTADIVEPHFGACDVFHLRQLWPIGFYPILCYADAKPRMEHNMERLSITVTGDMARRIEDAIASGRYASASEVIRDALREWEIAQARREQELLALRKDIAEGLADIEAGRVSDFDPKEIVRKGEKLLAAQNSRSA